MEEDYEKLLNQAYEKVKVSDNTGERFKIPEAKVFIEGNKTIISNFSSILSQLRRKPEHLIKFLSKELAAYSLVDEADRLVLNRKLPKTKIQDKLNVYVKEFVLCKECGKPDTEIIKEGNFSFVHCLACGAKHSISSKI